MRKKILIIIFLLISILFFSGITYSILNSSTSLALNQSIAKFVFDAKKTDTIELPLYDFKPGDIKDYKFQVSNNKEENSLNISSDVTIVYNIIIKTYHFMPLKIELYKEDIDSNEVLVMNCDESYSRNENNELVCKSSNQEMNYNTNINDNYIIRLTFDERYNSVEYSNIIDYIDLAIESYQDVGE